MVGSTGRGTTRAEDAQGTPTQSHISPSILVYEDKINGLGGGRRCDQKHEARNTKPEIRDPKLRTPPAGCLQSFCFGPCSIVRSRISGFVFRGWCFWCRVWGEGFARCDVLTLEEGSGFRVQGSGFRVQGLGLMIDVSGSGFARQQGGFARCDVLALEEVRMLLRPQVNLPSLPPHLPPYVLLRARV